MWIHEAQRFLFVKFVDLLEKNCASYSELSVPFRYDGMFSSNVKSSPQWSAWLSGISQRLERTIGILKFFSVFIKQGNQNREGKNCGSYTFYRLAIGGTLLRRSFSFTKIAFIHDFIRSSHVWFSYIQLFFHHFTGVFGTNIMNISQLAWLLSWWSVGQAWIFFFLRPYFHYYSNSVHYCEDRRNQSSGKCTDSPTNQFSNTFMINLF